MLRMLACCVVQAALLSYVRRLALQLHDKGVRAAAVDLGKPVHAQPVTQSCCQSCDKHSSLLGKMEGKEPQCYSATAALLQARHSDL
jgi:hypothetical protein